MIRVLVFILLLTACWPTDSECEYKETDDSVEIDCKIST
jgi:hypothetical protein